MQSIKRDEGTQRHTTLDEVVTSLCFSKDISDWPTCKIIVGLQQSIKVDLKLLW